MTLRWILAASHLLALGIGLGAIWARGRALRASQPLDAAAAQRALYADTFWGVSAVLWIVTGIIRAVSSLEKGAGYYFHNHFFLTKMVLLLVILALEVWPMMTLIKWRIQLGRGQAFDGSAARAIARISYIQAWVIVLMVLAAAAMARGLGAVGTIGE